MASAQIPALLRFLTQDAKVPLALAIGKTPELQKANLTSADEIAKADIQVLQDIFKDQKVAKQILNAGKRVSKKRGAPADNTAASPQKKKKNTIITKDSTPFDIESSLRLPTPSSPDNELRVMIIVTNRAPLVLAFAVCVLKYTMPEQPISSRLSLAQALVSANSRSKAVSLGIENGQSAEEEGWGEGQPVVKVLGRDIRVLKRWDYNPREGPPTTSPASGEPDSNTAPADDFLGNGDIDDADKMPPLWGVDLEAARSSQNNASSEKKTGGLPIYTAQSARSYLLRSISSVQTTTTSAKSKSNTATVQEKEESVACLLSVIDSVCRSWATTLKKDELDRRAWVWYLKVRPDVQSGVQGWGQKGQVKLSDILALRNDS
ncbi:uncharacterized protein N7496_001743 [Penicillium cataractarum]|uniref:Impact N-terminal domain-containing protein n=1 Tax=Penicillium cataractarum TaxID=2100454 RepID=A0A9W9VWS4_9EURO|nr:uncharacterized protein N7496_001743 [Penicillium cataractarum]KAJ5390675.1 hypothetical protein N7496_001743 [Penicillium cataractarum]